MPSFTTPNSDGEDYTRLSEAWSPAARAAAAAARKQGGRGTARRSIAAKKAFVKAGGKQSFGRTLHRVGKELTRYKAYDDRDNIHDDEIFTVAKKSKSGAWSKKSGRGSTITSKKGTARVVRKVARRLGISKKSGKFSTYQTKGKYGANIRISGLDY